MDSSVKYGFCHVVICRPPLCSHDAHGGQRWRAQKPRDCVPETQEIRNHTYGVQTASRVTTRDRRYPPRNERATDYAIRTCIPGRSPSALDAARATGRALGTAAHRIGVQHTGYRTQDTGYPTRVNHNEVCPGRLWRRMPAMVRQLLT